MTDSSISLANTPKPWLASPSQRWDTKLCKTNPRTFIKLIIDEISFHMLCVTLYVLAFYVYVHPYPYGHLGKTCCTNEPATWPHVSLWRLNIIDQPSILGTSKPPFLVHIPLLLVIKSQFISHLLFQSPIQLLRSIWSYNKLTISTLYTYNYAIGYNHL
jgi:hypothetical protein